MNPLAYSLVIPAYELPEELDITLAGVVQQTRLPAEVIVVDSSKDDRVRDVVERWRDRLPMRYLRLRAGGRGAWSSGANGSVWLEGGLDGVVPTWWGEVYFGAAGGALYSAAKWLPVVSGRAGFDLLLARPLYVGLGVSYGFGVATTHLIALNLRLGLAF